MTCTRPDLSYAVGKLSQYLSEQCQHHWVAAKYILKYLKGTSQYELFYQKSEKLGILAYSDADWAFDQSDRRSTTGFCFYLNKESSPISQKSKKQPTVALSTCESGYIGLAKTTRESLYLIQLLNGMDPQQRYEPAKILRDNQGAIALRTLSSSCRATSTDIPDPLSPLLPIVHRLWQVFRATSRILTQLLYVCSSWSSCFCSAICGGPQEYITYEIVLASPAVCCMSGASKLDSIRDGRQVAVQLVPCGVLPPGLVQYCSQHSCVIAVQLLLLPFCYRPSSASIQQY